MRRRLAEKGGFSKNSDILKNWREDIFFKDFLLFFGREKGTFPNAERHLSLAGRQRSNYYCRHPLPSPATVQWGGGKL
jgi:hypothetical protein